MNNPLMQLRTCENIWQFVLAEGNIILFAIKFSKEIFFALHMFYLMVMHKLIFFIKYKTICIIQQI